MGKFSAGEGGWQVSNVFFLLMLMLMLLLVIVIVIEMMETGVKVFQHE